MPEIKGYHHLSLSVTDLGKSTTWYCDVLGLEVDAEIEGKGFRRSRLRAPASGLTVTLTCHGEQLPGPFDEHRPGLDHVAFEVGEKQIEAFKQRFEQLGVFGGKNWAVPTRRGAAGHRRRGVPPHPTSPWGRRSSSPEPWRRPPWSPSPPCSSDTPAP